MTDTTTPNTWKGVPFYAGDTVLLEWTEDDNERGRAVWVVADSYVVDDPDFAELSDDNEEMGGLGLVVNGDENIHPTTLTVISPDASPISLDGYEDVDIADLEEGDHIIAQTKDETLTIEHTLTHESADGASEGQLYDVLGFLLDERITEFYRKVA